MLKRLSLVNFRAPSTHIRRDKMIITKNRDELDSALEEAMSKDLKVGFVPMMGALHEGHLSLIRVAREYSDIVVVSIFVNPTQFAPHEDFDAYPRHEEEDAEKLREQGVEILFLPSIDVLYPSGMESDIKPGSAAKGLETDFRPHFFEGVVNVVHRLFEAVKPDFAVFGEKDFQQLAVIKEMVQAEDLPVQIIGAPIVRDEHGLALSSRNAYLSPSELEISRNLNSALKDVSEESDLNETIKTLIEKGFDKIDYVEKRWGRVLAAAWLGKTRLIDNMQIK